MKSIALICSVLVNFALGGLLLYVTIQGSAETAGGRIGVLTKDTKVGVFNTDKVLFTLPKGLVVRDASATGAGWFEPHRFRIIVTSNDESLVDYGTDIMASYEQASEYYSAEVGK